MSINSTCLNMIAYATSVELRFSLLLNWVILVPSFPIIGYSFYYCWNQNVFHKNTQFLIIVHLGALLIHCFGRFLLHSLDLFNYFYPYTNGCQILPNFYRCLILRFFYIFGQAVVSMTPIFITLERLIAVRYNRTYENFSVNYGYLLGVFQLFLAFAYLSTRYIHSAFHPSSFTFLYCKIIVLNTITTAEMVLPLVMVIVSQMVSVVVFKILEMKNRKLREVVDINLSTRYTLEQAKRSFIALKCFMNFNCMVVSLILFGLVIIEFMSTTLTDPNFLAVAELTHALPLYGILVCVNVYWKLRQIDGQNKSKIRMALRERASHTDLYFEMFGKQLE